jgi:ketosteroid isomerase-like protein
VPDSLPILATRFVHALAEGDRDTVLALAGPGLELTIATAPRGVPRIVSGPEQLTALVGAVGLTWTKVRLCDVQAHAFADDPTRGVAQFVVEAVNRDGSAYHNPYVALVQTEDALITRWTEYYDPAPMVVALDALRAHTRATR